VHFISDVVAGMVLAALIVSAVRFVILSFPCLQGK
jgi:membrane-associated phospholipid phosphatase